MNITVILIVAGIVLCIAGSAFFSGAEMSYSSSSVVRLEHEAEHGSKTATVALKIIEQFDRTLATILIGNNLVNIAASSLVSVFILILTGSDSKTWIGTVIITVLIIVFGETLPKIIAKKRPNTLARRYAHFIRLLMFVLFPIVWIVAKLTALITYPFTKNISEEEDTEKIDELQSIIETAEDEGVLEEDESELLHSAIEFSDISASEVMTSRVDMEAIDIEDSITEILNMVNSTPYSRLPVYEENIDNIIGVIHINHFLKAIAETAFRDMNSIDIRSLMMPPCFVYKTMKLPEILRMMKKAKQHLAIVTDEYGGTLGCITLEDVLEEIVGDIWDENDKPEEEVVEHHADEFEIDGDMNLRDFIELTALKATEDDFESETAGGLIIEILGHYPENGEEFTYQNLLIRVLKKDDRRVEKIYIKIIQNENK